MVEYATDAIWAYSFCGWIRNLFVTSSPSDSVVYPHFETTGLIKCDLLKSNPIIKQPGKWQFSRGKGIMISQWLSIFFLTFIFELCMHHHRAVSLNCGTLSPRKFHAENSVRRSFWQNCENWKKSKVYLVFRSMHIDSFLFHNQ